MMQASHIACIFFSRAILREGPSQAQFMKYRYSGKAAFVLIMGCLLAGTIGRAQQAKVGTQPRTAPSPEKSLSLAEQGRCHEAIAGLKQTMIGQFPAPTRKQAGVLGIRCALAVDDRDSTIDFIRLLNRQFAGDPDVLFVVVHAYSDLSTRTAQDLGRTAPQSIAAHKLNAEALEMQGKWEPAQLEYEGILQKDPNARGIHFLLGRVLLSRPDAGPDAAERAKQEFVKELQIDPTNADAAYILGELARHDENWDEAISRFSQAAKLNPNFAEAQLGLGSCLVTLKKYEEAVPPLRRAEQLMPRNPEVHHELATALARSGHKEEADKEFAIHRNLTSAQGSEKPE